MNNKIISVAGPTASGKSDLALFLAERFDGEIISFDSMQIYRGMDIGTAKPAKDELARVRHHMIDIADPTENFSVADFTAKAKEIIADVQKRGKTPILCGGTGLYQDSLLRGTEFGELEADEAYRAELSEFAKANGNAALHALLEGKDPEAAEKIHMNNVKRVIRALEIIKASGITKTEWDKKALENATCVPATLIALNYRDREKLYARIDMRVDIMIENGLFEEVRALCESGKLIPGTTAYDAIGYKEMISCVRGEDSKDACAEKIKLATRHYAKRQLTWFLRSQNINWLYPDDYSSKEELYRAAEDVVCKDR
ncbi:MAG: tRNA (adenosine(37)-N6)-dimethylallyltransferase MiaA [Clostridia bacterium]|nr:tRNA (adenosine(37)-N6)-dimethylallyltransferase MiaA [Clostridia bacterium]